MQTNRSDLEGEYEEDPLTDEELQRLDGIVSSDIPLYDQSDVPLSPMEKAEHLIARILSTDPRVGPEPFAITFKARGSLPEEVGIEISLPLQDPDTSAVNMQKVSTRTVCIALTISEDLYTTRNLCDSYPEGLRIDNGVIPKLSNHERLVATLELQEELRTVGKSTTEISSLLAI